MPVEMSTETTVELLTGVYLHRRPLLLHIASADALSCLSSAVIGGGFVQTCHILNLSVPANYCCGNHHLDLQEAARQRGIAGPFIGMLTAARLEDARVTIVHGTQASVAAVVTLGISHPTASGVSAPAQQSGSGTINTIVLVDGRLSPAAHVNAVITATEAKSLVMAECSVHTPEGRLASGTGTDALVIACTGRGTGFEYGGPISPIGALIGQAVRAATLDAVFVWHARKQVEHYARTMSC